MELQDIIKTALGASIPLLIFFFGYLIKHRQGRKEGKHRNRIQFELEVISFGQQKGCFITEVTILLHNEGLVRKVINELRLSIGGIEKDTEIKLFENEDYPQSKADFSKKIVKTNVLKKKAKEKQNNDNRLQFEQKLINPRLTWLLASQSMLFVALAFVSGQAGQAGWQGKFPHIIHPLGLPTAGARL